MCAGISVLSGCTKNIIIDNTVEDGVGGAGGITDAYGIYSAGAETIIGGNTIDTITTSAGVVVGLYVVAANCTISNNIIKNLTRTVSTALAIGIWVSSAAATVNGNVIDSVSANNAGAGGVYGIYANINNTSLSGNIIKNIIRTVGTGNGTGIEITGAECGISGNSVDTATNYGIEIVGDDNRVDGNTVTACETGIIIQGAAENTVVNDNICLNNTTDFTDSGTGTMVGG